jgi:serine/threonine protein kinase
VPHKEILIGDVVSGLSALHLCNIVHGDVKLDNVLIFHSWDRPSKAQAKMIDFGHSIIIGGNAGHPVHKHVKYQGTAMCVILTYLKKCPLLTDNF